MVKSEELYEKIKPLLIKLNAQNVVPFVGAGFSYYFGYPLWNELLMKLVTKLEINNGKVEYTHLNKHNPLQIAESLWLVYKDKNKDDIIENFLKELKVEEDTDINYAQREYVEQRAIKYLEMDFNKIVCECIYEFKQEEKRSDHNAIEILKKLSNDFCFHNIVTTNYDDVLEKEIFKKKGYKVLYPRSGDELNHNDCDKTIYKIHGDIRHEQSIILTNSQYYRFMSNENYYKGKIYTIFASNTILMLGYGFSDINIHEIYFQYRNDYKDDLKELDIKQPKVYLVIRKGDKYIDKKKGIIDTCYDLYKRFLEGCGFVIIDEYESLIDFVEDLIEGWSRYVQSLSVEDLIPYNHLLKLYTIVESLFINNPDTGSQEIEIEIAKSYIKLLNLNFSKPNLLSGHEFNIMEKYNLDNEKIVPREAGCILLKFVKDAIISRYPQIGEENEYRKLVLNALVFAEQSIGILDDFYKFPEPFGIFIDLCIGLKNFEFNQREKFDFCRFLGKEIDFCSYEYNDYGCRASGNKLRSSLHIVPIQILKLYVKAKKDGINEWKCNPEKFISEDKNYYPSIREVGHREYKWLKCFKGRDGDLDNMIDELIKAQFH